MVTLTLVAYLWQPVSQLELVQESADETNEASLYMKNVYIREFGQDGKLQYVLSAEQASLHQNQETTSFIKPHLRIYLLDGSANPFELWADSGKAVIERPSEQARLNAANWTQATERVILLGSVRLEKTQPSGSYLKFSTDSLTLEPEARHASTDAAVMIEFGFGSIKGYGMEVSLPAGKYQIYSDERGRVESVFSSDRVP